MFPKRECGSKRVKPQVSLRKMQVHPYRSMPPALPKPSMVPSAERKRTTSLPSLRTPSSACAGACRSPMFREHRYLCPPARTQHRCIFVCFSSCQGGTHEQHLCLPAPCHNRCNFVCFFFLPGAWTSSTSRVPGMYLWDGAKHSGPSWNSWKASPVARARLSWSRLLAGKKKHTKLQRL